MDASRFRETETLKNGVAVTIRAIRPADKAGVVEAFGKLERESVYTRFFQAKESLSDRDLEAATNVDFKDAVALVVTTEVGGREILIAGGRYVVCSPSGPRSAEVAFLVEEDYHGQGIAGRLLRHLARIAREQGVEQLEADVLPQNKAMLAVFARSGLPLKQAFAEGAVHVTLSLTAPA